MTKKFQPFADDSASLNIGDFTVENGTDKVALYGSLDVTRDKAGLKNAKALKSAVDAIVKALEQDKELPDESGPTEAPQQVKNPFA
ncbi:hypothetical protein [Microvirga lotononidis]|uniref:Uncharacterized protein n=1 Tax=Microvirga lotononidis TaxID=864069 RepID=I4Z401_9HYPH|nr:hypothetical protein [Microvirga lotononidis]EIM30943.1 hypothetical protein MicloDRAFT_00004720 [Microvirga lotononidis]WQO30291.1 hypothetical protein U0023_28825 [Microvirga lotononidis]